MMSLDASDLLPPELTAILARLRDSAHFMPPAQLNAVLTRNWAATGGCALPISRRDRSPQHR